MQPLVIIAVLLTSGGFLLGPDTDLSTDRAGACLIFSVSAGVAWVVWAVSFFYSQEFLWTPKLLHLSAF